MDKFNEQLKTIIKYYGPDKQLAKTREELIELLHIIRKDDFFENELIDELADVYIMLAQLKVMEALDEQRIRNRIEYKINRTLEKINDGN